MALRVKEEEADSRVCEEKGSEASDEECGAEGEEGHGEGSEKEKEEERGRGACLPSEVREKGEKGVIRVGTVHFFRRMSVPRNIHYKSRGY